MKKTMIGTLALAALLTSSCMDGFLDRNPYGSIDETTFFTEAEHANLAAMACYSKLAKQNKHWADAQLELGMTGDFSPAGFKDASVFYLGTFNPNESNIVLGAWQCAYQGIAVCNKNIEGVTGMSSNLIDDETRNQYLAEMRFIRAYWYFRLIQLYGDVPLRSASVIDPTDAGQVQLGATPEETILSDLIVPDLQFAAQYLPESWDTDYMHRATKGTAYAYLCEVYLYMKDYDNAILAGQEVEKRDYALEEDPGCVLRIDKEDSKEIIFSVGIANGNGSYREFYFGTIEDTGEFGRIMRGDTYSGDYFYPSEGFVNCFQAIDGSDYLTSPYYTDVRDDQWKNRDPRFDATFFTPQDDVTTTTGVEMKWQQSWLVNTQTGYDIQKRGVWYGNDNWNFRVDFHLMRLPRIYLHMAEAYALKSTPDYTKCAEYVEKVRGRARAFALANRDKYVPAGLTDDEVLPPFTINSQETAMAAIDYESRVEFFTEDCIRYYDLKRWGTLKDVWPVTLGGTWEDRLFDLPYPASELSANHALTQHSGWGS